MLHAALAALVLAAATGYVVVLDDGSRFTAAGPPGQRSGLAIARLADGTTVSLLAARVDWEATRRANQPGEGGHEARASTTAAAARRRAGPVITNQTIQAYSEANPPRPLPEEGLSAVTELPGPARPVPRIEPRPPADDQGNGPAYWRERAAILRDRERAALRALDAARRSHQAEQDALLHGRVVSGSSGLEVRQFLQSREELAAAQFRISQLEEKVRDAEARVEEARQERADLREEARQAGADPGWLRLPVAFR